MLLQSNDWQLFALIFIRMCSNDFEAWLHAIYSSRLHAWHSIWCVFTFSTIASTSFGLDRMAHWIYVSAVGGACHWRWTAADINIYIGDEPVSSTRSLHLSASVKFDCKHTRIGCSTIVGKHKTQKLLPLFSANFLSFWVLSACSQHKSEREMTGGLGVKRAECQYELDC